MKILYSILILLYSSALKAASIFSQKALYRVKGIKQTFSILNDFSSDKTIWVHCASLGEFEQGRSFIESVKKNNPAYKIALSFFSPSGYEIRKDYEFADVVFYLPSDTKRNAKKLLLVLNPELVVFVKYEFWHWYINEIHKKNIPLYLISGIFRKDQIFFKPYGTFFRAILGKFTHLFIQNELSGELLKSINAKHFSITGDTRFDRVFEIAQSKKRFEHIEKFLENKPVLIAGSTWEQDEKLIFSYINKFEDLAFKLIIAPHEIKNENILRIMHMSDKKMIRYSKAISESVKSADIMIIDNIGMLSSLYAYADIAYIGGGFGAGIHNTLEAAVFGIPVIFGPNFHKFDEAKELIKRSGGFSIKSLRDFKIITDKLFAEKEFRDQSGKACYGYVKENIGSTDKILGAMNL